MKPTLHIIKICNENPNASRKQVLDLCEQAGLKRTTASTYYAKWKRERNMFREATTYALPEDSITFKECKKVARSLNENKDCAVMATSIVCQKPYAEVREKLFFKGRAARDATYPWQYKEVIRDYGFEIEKIELEAKTVRTAGRELAYRFFGQKALVRVRGHVAAFDGTKIDDWSIDSRRRILSVFLVKVK